MEEVEGAPAGGDEPEQHVGKVEPDSLLHAHDAAIAFRVLVDIHAGEDADDGSVKDAIIVTPVLAISLSLTHISKLPEQNVQDQDIQPKHHGPHSRHRQRNR